MSQKEIKDLVLIHGWGFNNRVWENLIPYLESQWRITCIDLPGYGAREKLAHADIDQIVRNIESDVPKNAVLFAWSLGGLIAMKLAHSRSDIKALVLVASSPCFLNKQDWQHGVDPADFDQLLDELGKDKIKTLQTFAGLVAMGEEHPRQTLNELNEQLLSNVPDQETLMSGLEILRDEDLRLALIKQHCPIGIIFGENDILVKHSTVEAIQESRQDIHTIEISATGHAPFLSHPRETADALMKLTARLI
ncbi:MAG: pimeloyl-ACP methyl ester esterase BioH [Gammaproteobacteria bacterium]|nr:pimeloyl-ACP methyl ester esterase BioH [Gammaproteobacteria bacterium]